MLSTYVVSDSSTQAIGPRTLENLSPEILMIIFEQLHVLDPASFPALLSLSRRLHRFIAPLRYSNISLTPKMLDFKVEAASRSTFLEQVAAYCRQVYILMPRLSQDLDSVAYLLLKLSCLREISWYTIEGRDPRHRRITPIPPLISKIISQSSPPIRFNLSCHQVGHHTDKKFFESIPALHLKSMHFVPSPTPPPSLPLQGSFNKMLVQARNLQYLELFNPSNRKSIPFPCNYGPLPPLKSLTIERVDWPFTSETISQVWNFSKLEEILYKKPKGTELSSFISSIPPTAVRQLRSLRITIDFLRFGPATSAAGLTAKLCNWIEHAPFLEIIEIPCLFEELNLSVVLGCRHLRVLRLRDFGDLEPRVFPPGQTPRESDEIDLGSLTLQTGPSVSDFSDTSCYPALAIESIEKLKEACPLIEELDIGFNNKHENIFSFIDRLLGFKRLRRLTLRTETLQGRYHRNHRDNDVISVDDIFAQRDKLRDIDRSFASKIFDQMHDRGVDINWSLVIVGLRHRNLGSNLRTRQQDIQFRARQYQCFGKGYPMTVVSIS